MSQNIPAGYMPDPAPRMVMYPTTQVPSTIPPDVDLSTDFSTRLAEGGFPDLSEANAGIAFARAQRMAARQGESSAALRSRQTAMAGLPNAAYYGPAPAYYGPAGTLPVGPAPAGPVTGGMVTVVDDKGDKQILQAERRQNRLLERLLNRRKRKKKK